MTTVTNRFEDSRGWCCAAFNEVSIDYNAAFTGALARLAAFYDGMKSFSDCTLDLGWTHPNATLVRHQVKSNAGICLCLCCELPGLLWSALDLQAGILSSCLVQAVHAILPEILGEGVPGPKEVIPCHAGRKAAVAGGRLLPQLLRWRESPHLASSGRQPQGGDAIQGGCQQGCRQGQRSSVQQKKRRRVCFVCDGSLAVGKHAIFFCLRCEMTFPSAYSCHGLLQAVHWMLTCVCSARRQCR